MTEKQWSNEDKYYMAHALTLAEKGYGCVSPNPYVGAVVVKEGQIIGEGYHQKVGEAHAEINAIAAAKKQFPSDVIQGSTIYVTLEPCCHVGKTGACSKAIVEAGIKRVVSAMEDPNPLVEGKGHAYLAEQGISVSSGLLEDQSRFINRHFIHNQVHRRPFVTLKAALSLDGKLATSTGESQWITCEQARRKVHDIRGRHDAILIGKGTLIADNPSLTVRYGFGDAINVPLRVVLITDFSDVHPNYKLFDTTQAPTLVITTDESMAQDRWQQLFSALKAQGVMMSSLAHPSPKAIIELLKTLNIHSLMLEGGAKIYDEFLQARCVDELALFYGPRLIGDKDAYQLWTSSAISELNTAPVLTIYQAEQVGKSVYVNAFFKGEE